MIGDFRSSCSLLLFLSVSRCLVEALDTEVPYQGSHRTKRAPYGQVWSGPPADIYGSIAGQSQWSLQDPGPKLFSQLNENSDSLVSPEFEFQYFQPHSVELRDKHRFQHSFVGKRDPEVDRPDFDGLDVSLDDNDEGIELTERRGPQFSHNFIGKRFHAIENDHILKRIPAQLFSRRAPHYSHSFVGKRSGGGTGSYANGLFAGIPDQNDVSSGISGFPDKDVLSSDADIVPETDDYVRVRDGVLFQVSQNPLAHKIVKRSNVAEDGSVSVGQNLVEKRAPRFGHSFVGKREDGTDSSDTEEGNGEKGDQVDIPYNLENNEESVDSAEEMYDDELDTPEKRQQRQNRNHQNFLGKRPSYSHSYVGKRALSFGHSFVGKRAPRFGHSFVGKRGPRFGHSFVGKRPEYSHSFVGKRDFDYDYYNMEEEPTGGVKAALGDDLNQAGVSDVHAAETISSQEQNSNASSTSSQETNTGAELASHSSDTSEDQDKRAPGFGHSFVGKRAPRFGHSFVGKRAPRFGHSFVGKRAPRFGHSFVGKRAPRFGHSFVGKRAPRFGHSFVGKRAPRFGHSFVGKRGPAFGHSFVGKRAPRFGHSFVGKRAPRFGHSFVGKRAPRFGHSFVGKRLVDLDTTGDYSDYDISPNDVLKIVELIASKSSLDNKSLTENLSNNRVSNGVL